MRKFFFGLFLVGLLFASLTMWQGQSGKTATISTASVTGALNSLVQRAHQNSSTDLVGSPSISASFIDRVLAAYRSPAQGTGQALYSLGVQYGIDPIYALAFFMHESTFATAGVARATLSLGNIRCSAGYVCIQGFRAYQSYQAGYLDWYRLIRNLYITQWHLSTVEQIIPTYAPESDHNNVAGYIAAINGAVQTWRSGKVEV